jgi:methyl-accepting chemotaxis protein
MCAPSPPAAEQQSSTIEEINRYVDYINRISNEMRGQ